MNERLIESLDKIQEYIEATEGFVTEQAPLVAQEIILRGQILSAMGVVMTATVAVIPLIVWLCFHASSKTSRNEIAQEGWGIFLAFFGAGTIITTCMVAEAVTPWFMPRLYLLEQISGML